MAVKTCFKCDTPKPATTAFFYTHPTTKDGLLNKCKDCTRADLATYKALHPEKVRARNRDYYSRNLDAAKAYHAARYLADKDGHYARCRVWVLKNKERTNAKARAKYAADPSRFLQNNRNSYARRRDAILAKDRAYRLANLDHVRGLGREHAARRRAAKLGAVGTHTRVEFIALAEAYGWRCVYCDVGLTKQSATEDHVIALARGGSDGIENIVPACLACNRKKNARPVHQVVPLAMSF